MKPPVRPASTLSLTTEETLSCFNQSTMVQGYVHEKPYLYLGLAVSIINNVIHRSICWWFSERSLAISLIREAKLSSPLQLYEAHSERVNRSSLLQSNVSLVENVNIRTIIRYVISLIYWLQPGQRSDVLSALLEERLQGHIDNQGRMWTGRSWYTTNKSLSLRGIIHRDYEYASGSEERAGGFSEPKKPSLLMELITECTLQ